MVKCVEFGVKLTCLHKTKGFYILSKVLLFFLIIELSPSLWDPNRVLGLNLFAGGGGFFCIGSTCQLQLQLQLQLSKRGDLSGKVFENAIFVDAMLEAKLLPELHTDLVAVLPDLKRDDFPRHFLFVSRPRRNKRGFKLLWRVVRLVTPFFKKNYKERKKENGLDGVR